MQRPSELKRGLVLNAVAILIYCIPNILLYMLKIKGIIQICYHESLETLF